MALLKKLKLENGIEVNYHRVVSVQSITNVQTIIEVASYISEEERTKEQEYFDYLIDYAEHEEEYTKLGIPRKEAPQIFIYTKYYTLDYDSNISVANSYDYLKNLDDFKNAENH